MYSKHQIKAAAATLTVGFLLAIAFAGPAQAGNGTSNGWTAQELKAMQVRGDAMNRHYRLGAYSSVAAATAAEELRSDAMNRFYHLGAYSSAVTTAQQRRAEATNRYYRVGRYAVVSVSSRFDWSDAGIGAGVMLGVLMVAGGLAVAARRRVTDKASFPSTT